MSTQGNMLMSGGDTKNSNDMLMMMLAFGGGNR